MMDKRLGGIFILLGAGALPFIVVEYVLISQNFPGLNASTSELHSYYQQYYTDLARGWRFEMIAMALLGAGALVQMKDINRSGWALTAIGVALVLPMYAAMIGGYGTIVSQEQFDLAGYRTIVGFATSVFDGGNFVFSLGLAVALFQEAKLTRTGMPGWLLICGSLAQFAASVGFAFRHFGGELPLPVMGIPALLGFVVVAVFGAYVTFGDRQARA